MSDHAVSAGALTSPRAIAGRGLPARLIVTLVALALALHLPGLVLRLFNSDEASIATMAMVINDGGTLYHETADRKPPLVPYLYATVFAITGSHDLRPVRALGALTLAATAALLAAEARRRYKSDRAALLCGVLFLLSYVSVFPADSQAASFELFMILPVTAAVITAMRGHALAAGACLALGFLCKQTAATALVPIAYMLYLSGGWRAVARACAAACGLVGLTALVFGPSQFLLWTVTGNGGYLAIGGSLSSNLLRGLGMTAALVGLEIGIVLLSAHAWRRRLASPELWLWLASAAVGVVAGLRFFGHYYLELLAPLSLIATPAVIALAAQWRRWAFAGMVVPALGVTGAGFVPAGDEGIQRFPAVAQRVKAVTDPDDTLFVWGQLPELYWAADRVPATRFIHTGFLTGNSAVRPSGSGRPSDGIPGAWTMLARDLSERPPDLVADVTHAKIRGSQYYPLTTTPLWKTIVRDYHLVATVNGVRLYRFGPGHEDVPFAAAPLGEPSRTR
jgi:4-amino-4-deoxy-L-arabinose transferase-like glycosyltransferase